MAKKLLRWALAIASVAAVYISQRAISERMMDSDWECLRKAHTIAMYLDKKPQDLSNLEHLVFLQELGVPVTLDAARKGTFSYAIKRGIFFESKISVYFGEKPIGSFSRNDLEGYLQRHAR